MKNFCQKTVRAASQNRWVYLSTLLTLSLLSSCEYEPRLDVIIDFAQMSAVERETAESATKSMRTYIHVLDSNGIPFHRYDLGETACIVTNVNDQNASNDCLQGDGNPRGNVLPPSPFNADGYIATDHRLVVEVLLCDDAVDSESGEAVTTCTHQNFHTRGCSAVIDFSGEGGLFDDKTEIEVELASCFVTGGTFESNCAASLKNGTPIVIDNGLQNLSMSAAQKNIESLGEATSSIYRPDSSGAVYTEDSVCREI